MTGGTRRTSWPRWLTLAVALAVIAACSTPPPGKRVIVLGFDGLDYEIVKDLIARGRLPHFAELAGRGGFAALQTTIPPQSPVAWATFITGLDPGQHGLFDFVHRDPKTMVPYLSTTRTTPAERTLTLGRWQLPLSSGKVELLRRGRPFWEALEQRGIETTIIRMPANFPPSGTATRELSGMGTPDILGTYGTFSFFTSAPASPESKPLSGGVRIDVDVVDGIVRGDLEGPNNPFLVSGQPVRAPFTAIVDAGRSYVKLAVGEEERLLKVGEWSDWVAVEFPLIPSQSLHAEARFFLKQIEPYFELYVSPLNLDPLAPALPISHPRQYAGELARATGRFYSQGMPEETKGLKTGILTPAQFLTQAGIAGDENVRQYRYVLDGFSKGLLFYYFGNTDQVSHMMWRARDPQHPAYDAATDARFHDVVEQQYVRFDGIVGETMARLNKEDLLVVMSDHGFTSWRRSFHLNSWLRQQGYLHVIDDTRPDNDGLFENVDWSRTRAYALGLNGLYLNLAGREMHGIVSRAEREQLIGEITQRLLSTIDPATGAAAVTRVFRSDQAFTLASDETAPDLIVGYTKGTRSSDESALGGLEAGDVIVNNTDAWSGDHCMDPAAVPGILLTSRQLRRQAGSLQSLAAAILAEFGVDNFPGQVE